ncbi:lysophospholipid acyltransferase family protein [Solimonas soli]|uniref:lysophospholipid acyltransferase family protein n=1 Tax=Solimonas soli TaxID=413479 RepID=UPI0004B2C25C|nr:lysophospholipid acyltransferase family protein [Solimonas soli]
MTNAVTAWLDRRWRQFATGLSFGIFGGVGLLFGITLFPAVCLPARDAASAKRRAQRIVWGWFWTFSRIMRALGVITWEIRGAEQLRVPGRLIIANHPTLIDVVLLIGHVPRVDCIVKEALFRNPFTRLPVRWAGYISNRGAGSDDALKLVADCAATLKAGNSLMIFPEGTRSKPGEPLQIPHTAARIALESGAPILPVTIRCTPLMLNKGRPWYDVPPRPGHFVIEVGEPYRAQDLVGDAPTPTIAARRLSHEWVRRFGGRAAPLALLLSLAAWLSPAAALGAIC